MRNLIAILTISVLVAAMVGCEKYTSGYDTNPLAPQTANAAKTFIGAQLAYVEFTEGTCSWLAAIFVDQLHGAQRQFSAYDVYNVNAEDFINDWPLAYADVLKNLRLVEGNAAVGQKLKGAAEVLEGLHMGNVAAMWGDVPYSEAVQGLSNTTPHFDAQQTVYTAALATLDQGIADLTATASGTFGDAFSYGGNATKWVKLAHSAKARYLMHLARGRGTVNAYDGATLATVITEASLGLSATNGSDDLMFVHSTGAYNGDMNLWYSFGVYDRSGYMDASGCFAVTMLKNRKWDGRSNELARMAFYFDTTGWYRGTVPTDLNYNPGGAYDAISPYPGFRASENLLLLAEAQQRTAGAAVSTTALANLNLARTYNDAVFGTSSAAFIAGDFANGGALLQTILNEEYLAVMHQMEAFSLARRVDYKFTWRDSAGNVTQMAPKNATKGFAYRFIYGSSEHEANPNTPTETVGVLDQFTRTWGNH